VGLPTGTDPTTGSPPGEEEGPWGQSLQAVRKRDLAGCDEWPADLELNLSVPEKGDRARVAGEAPSIEERRDAPMLRTDLLAIEGPRTKTVKWAWM